MLAHVGSLLDAGHEVDLVGSGRTPLPSVLQDAPRLHVHVVDTGHPGRVGRLGVAVAMGIRGVRLGWRLSRTLLWEIPPPDVMLVQVPPSLPTVPVAVLAARLRRATLIVDWHNLGWSVLALRLGTRHALVRATRYTELALGRRADGHVAVSSVLSRWLAERGMGPVAVLHDGVSSIRPFPPARTDLPRDPLVVVAPMGWTRDDDLPLLGEAIRLLTKRIGAATGYRKTLRLIVSGNGPLRADWSPRLRALAGDGLRIETPDVSVDEYPTLLASAHLGLSIHRSSSAMDLPMKVVEFRAVGLPVLALEDDAPLEEIAPPGCGVLRYGSGEELAERLFTMLGEIDAETGLLARLTAEARSHHPASWETEWTRVMTPLLSSARERRPSGRGRGPGAQT